MTSPTNPGQHQGGFGDGSPPARWRVERATRELDRMVDDVNTERERRLIHKRGSVEGALDARRDRRRNRLSMLGEIITPAQDELARAREQGDHTLLERAHAAARLTDRLPQPLHRAASVAHQQHQATQQAELMLTRRMTDLTTAAAKAAKAKAEPSGGRGALTDRQAQILDVIRKYVTSRGYPPSVREIGEAVGIKSTNAVHGHLARLANKGFIQRDGAKPRAIQANTTPHGRSSVNAEQLAKQRADTRAQIDALRAVQRDLEAVGAATVERVEQLRNLDLRHDRTLSRGTAALEVLGERGYPTEHEAGGVRVDGVLDTRTGTVRLGPWDTTIAQPSREEEAPHTLGGANTVEALHAENARTRDGRPDTARREQTVRDRAQLAEMTRQLDPSPAPAPAPAAGRQRPARPRQPQPASRTRQPPDRLAADQPPPRHRDRDRHGKRRRDRGDDDGRER
jgi:predicted ArsR family transcriptional regulator